MDTSTFPEFRKYEKIRGLHSAVPRGSFLNQKSDLPLARLRRGHELPYGVKHNFELRVAFFLRLRASWAFDASIWRSRTKARMISIFTWIARSLLRTVDNMATRCSVKAYGVYRLPPRPLFEVAICDLKRATSSEVNWNMKSSGKRDRLRLTCSFIRLVVTPYRTARSASSRTLCPRIIRIDRSIRSVGNRAGIQWISIRFELRRILYDLSARGQGRCWCAVIRMWEKRRDRGGEKCRGRDC
jgi:hypothetical protein